ncbi:hypothetical protein MUP79_08165 [Candidatus Bathyarchaeota archaeon]|nr:hypothetical protein [Candidatus Bathyarchaeota archaeon]
MKTIDKILRIIEVVAITASLVLASFAYKNTLDYYEKALNLENINTRLSANQTLLQVNITELTENQTKLQYRILELENYEPTVRAQLIQSILIGPTPPIDVFPSGIVSFQYNGTLHLNLTVLVSTAHSGELIIAASSMHFYGYNTSELQISFSGLSGISAEDYVRPFTAGSADIIPIVIPFRTFYRFTESHILEYEHYDIGYIGFSLVFHDFQTDTIKYSETLQTSFQWNNQTSLP